MVYPTAPASRCSVMPGFVVANLSKATVSVGIEPWAQAKELAPDARIEFCYDDPGEISFCYVKDGQIDVGVMSEHVRWSANGRDYEFRSPESDE